MFSKATILVVEDNELNMKMAKDLLDLAGFEILEAEDAATGINLAKTRQPDLVLMDMHMPVCDGYQATRHIKADPETNTIPIVAFTALAMEDEQKKAIQSGCSGVICKPIDVDTFAQTVASYLRKTSEDAQRESFAPASPTSREEHGPILSLVPPISPEPPAELPEEDVEEFIYRVSHDLQSPLRKIRQFSGFLKDSAQAELSHDNFLMLEALDRATGQMHELLSDLLLLSRIGRLEGNLTEFSLGSAIKEAWQKNQDVVEEKKAELDLGEMVILEGNYHQIVQLFYQMIQNSLKYCAKGTVPHIRIGCRAGAADGCVEILMQDNGLGFKTEYANEIFKPLQRLHGVTKYPGTGVGLAIVKKIVQRHHGSICADSVPNQGTTFTIRLPMKQA